MARLGGLVEGEGAEPRSRFREIESALRARGMSARQASLDAVGNPELVRRMRRGQVPTVERLRALCEVLDLEFYVGRRREPAPVDERRLELAVETAVRALEAKGKDASHGDTARLVVAVYQLIGEEGAHAPRVRQLLRMVSEGR